jgi:hypothetical protein
MTFDAHGAPTTMARALAGHGQTADGINKEICLGIEHEVQIDVSARYVSIPNDDPATRCKASSPRSLWLQHPLSH